MSERPLEPGSQPPAATGPGEPVRRPPTAAEAKAIGHPLRMRIIFACRDRARTNKELAEALGTTPGTIHYHLKPLVAQGFLRPEQPRPGPRGSTEQPYRSTGKSWQLSGTPAGARTLLQAGIDELLATADEDVLDLTRLGLTLSPDEVDELQRRLREVIEAFAARSRTAPDPAGTVADGAEAAGTSSIALFVALHRTPPGSRGHGQGQAG